MTMHPTMGRRMLCATVLGYALVGSALADSGSRWLVAFEAPSEHVLHELAAASRFDVRWVEEDLVLAEVPRPDDVPNLWGGRVVARRDAGVELALLHGRTVRALRKSASASVALRSLRAAHVATLHSARDEVWVLLGAPEDWPPELLGCHGRLVLPRHRVDPRSLLASGPPVQLLPWVWAPRRDWTAGERHVLNAVDEDSLIAFFNLLTRNESNLPADRYVFSPDLQELYIPRVEATMNRAVAGIAGASVEVQPFEKTRACRAGTDVWIDSVATANVIAKLPGSVPGTGTFVVCAHIDATGSNDPEWVSARGRCESLAAAPGGEDNASGVAAVLEALRCISDGVRSGAVSFAFDLEFVAFSGEEAEGTATQPGGRSRSLTGSEAYVEERIGAGVTLLGAFNLDMIGSEQLANNLQLVHNPASRWLADFVVEAAGFVSPPLDLTFSPEDDAQRASDHNSFWSENATAILGADAPIDTLRSYATYHRPLDTGFDRDVRSRKMREVTGAVVATLLRFDTSAHAQPALFVPAESFRTTFELNNDEANYDPTFLRLFPGEVVTVRLKLFNLGAVYDGPVRLTVRKERQDGTSVIVVDDPDTKVIQTGGLVQFEERVPIVEGDNGVTRVVADVSWDSSSASVSEELVVRGRHNPESAAFRPNPAPDIQSAQLLMELSEPGMVTVRLYNLEGEEVYVGTQRVEHRVIRPGEERVLTAVSLAEAGPGAQLSLVSGPYFARVQFDGDDGSRAASAARLVIIR